MAELAQNGHKYLILIVVPLLRLKNIKDRRSIYIYIYIYIYNG